MVLEIGVIEQAKLGAIAPMIMVSKKVGLLRFCPGGRKVDAIPVHNSNSIPTIDELIDSQMDALVFWTKNINARY